MIMGIKMVDELAHLLDWQNRGSTARVLGLPITANPLLPQKPAENCFTRPLWQAHVDAWLFGWMIEGCFRDDSMNLAA